MPKVFKGIIGDFFRVHHLPDTPNTFFPREEQMERQRPVHLRVIRRDDRRGFWNILHPFNRPFSVAKPHDFYDNSKQKRFFYRLFIRFLCFFFLNLFFLHSINRKRIWQNQTLLFFNLRYRYFCYCQGTSRKSRCYLSNSYRRKKNRLAKIFHGYIF